MYLPRSHRQFVGVSMDLRYATVDVMMEIFHIMNIYIISVTVYYALYSKPLICDSSIVLCLML